RCAEPALFTRIQLIDDVQPTDGRDLLLQLSEGRRFVGNNFVFASLISLALFNALFCLSYISLLPVFAEQYFGAGSTGYGLLSAAHGAGSMVGTLIIATAALRVVAPGLVM